jgi:type IV secretion system protein VirB6
VNVFSSLFDTIDTVLATFVNSAVTAAVGYVDGPIALVGIISFIGMGAVLLFGRAELPVGQFVKTGAMLALVLAIAGTTARYNDYFGDHLRGLPNELLATFALIGGEVSDTASIGTILDDIAERSMDGIAAIWAAAGVTNVGAYMLAAVLFVVFLIFGVAVTIAVATMKIGISLVVATGPLMLLGLLTPSTREFFTRWLSYGLQFAMLGAFIGAVSGLGKIIVDTYLGALHTTSDTIDIVALMAPALVLLLLAKVFAELPSMASSITGGIGLGIGHAAQRGMAGLGSTIGHHLGGKQIDAWRDAARWRRVRGAEALHERMVETRQAVVDRLLHGSNRVSRTDGGKPANPDTPPPDHARAARDHIEARRRRRAGAAV